MKGSQYLTTIQSGANRFNSLPTLSQFSGLMVLMDSLILRSAGLASLEYWVLPGKRKDGYCKEKVYSKQLKPED
jgi:hypothetical protein